MALGAHRIEPQHGTHFLPLCGDMPGLAHSLSVGLAGTRGHSSLRLNFLLRLEARLSPGVMKGVQQRHSTSVPETQRGHGLGGDICSATSFHIRSKGASARK